MRGLIEISGGNLFISIKFIICRKTQILPLNIKYYVMLFEQNKTLFKIKVGKNEQ